MCNMDPKCNLFGLHWPPHTHSARLSELVAHTTPLSFDRRFSLHMPPYIVANKHPVARGALPKQRLELPRDLRRYAPSLRTSPLSFLLVASRQPLLFKPQCDILRYRRVGFHWSPRVTIRRRADVP